MITILPNPFSVGIKAKFLAVKSDSDNTLTHSVTTFIASPEINSSEIKAMPVCNVIIPLLQSSVTLIIR